jgi:hypothetical protein
MLTLEDVDVNVFYFMPQLYSQHAMGLLEN